MLELKDGRLASKHAIDNRFDGLSEEKIHQLSATATLIMGPRTHLTLTSRSSAK